MKNLLRKATIFSIIITGSAVASEPALLSIASNSSLKSTSANMLNPDNFSLIIGGSTYLSRVDVSLISADMLVKMLQNIPRPSHESSRATVIKATDSDYARRVALNVF